MTYENFCKKCMEFIGADSVVSVQFHSDGTRYSAKTSNGYTIVGYKDRLVVRIYDNAKRCAVGSLSVN